MISAVVGANFANHVVGWQEFPASSSKRTRAAESSGSWESGAFASRSRAAKPEAAPFRKGTYLSMRVASTGPACALVA
jgi:hypothetical protein